MTLTRSEKLELLKIAQELDRRKMYSGWRKWFVDGGPYSIDKLPKHRALCDATANYREIGAFACNRGGKTKIGAFITALVLTGEYPDWWGGLRTKKPIRAWACGLSAQKTRDTVQRDLLGPPGQIGTGMIPADRIIQIRPKDRVPNAIESVIIQHSSGGTSYLVFKDYSQKTEAFYGEELDWIWNDEEPPELLYNEELIRTLTTGGKILTTATPLHGPTPFMVGFNKHADFLADTEPLLPLDDIDTEERRDRKTRTAIIQWGWNHCPWIGDAEKEELLERTPENIRKSRSEGRLAIGSGNVYPYDLEDMVVDPFTIPDEWPRIYGFDPKFQASAAIFLAKDPASGIVYLYDELYCERMAPDLVATHLKRKTNGWIPGVIDTASLQGNNYDGQQLFQLYHDLVGNLTMADNRKGSVDVGIEEVRQLMTSGRFKIFRTIRQFRKEYVLYRYDEKRPGKVVKEFDDAMDACRYAVVALDRAKPRIDREDFVTYGTGSGRTYF